MHLLNEWMNQWINGHDARGNLKTCSIKLKAKLHPEKKFAKQISNKGLTSGIYKLLQLNNKGSKKKNPVKKISNRFEQILNESGYTNDK